MKGQLVVTIETCCYVTNDVELVNTDISSFSFRMWSNFRLSQSKLQIIDKIIYFVTKQHNEKLLYKHWLNQIVKRRKQIDEKHFNRKIYWRQVCTSYQIDSHLDLCFSCELFARDWYWVCHQLSKCTATIKPVLCDLPRVQCNMVT